MGRNSKVRDFTVLVTFTGDEGVANRRDTFAVTEKDEADAKHAALTLALDAWDVPTRFGMTLGVFHATVFTAEDLADAARERDAMQSLKGRI